MKLILKWKWPIVALWVAAAVLLISFMPDMGQLIREKGQAGVPEKYSSKQADRLLREMNQSVNENEMPVIVVFHNRDKLDDRQMDEIKNAVRELEQQKSGLKIVSVMSHINNEDMQEQMLSKDGTTALVLVTVDMGTHSKEEIGNLLTERLNNVQVDHYLTGSELIMEDFVKTTQAGIKKTEGVAVAFIIIVLILIFRSPVTPVISLITVVLTFF